MLLNPVALGFDPGLAGPIRDVRPRMLLF